VPREGEREKKGKRAEDTFRDYSLAHINAAFNLGTRIESLDKNSIEKIGASALKNMNYLQTNKRCNC
jgi:hypothetical protein